MSFSEPTIKNPATKFIDFKSDSGTFQYYDKETEKNITIPFPLYFVVLDELSTISGFCEKTKSGIYSNEVHRISEEPLNVRTFKGGEGASGLYKEISDRIKVLGGKFTKSVYAMLIHQDKEPELVNFRCKGAFFSAWIDKKIDTSRTVVGITGIQKATKGTNTYNVPIIKPFKMSEELSLQATAMDQELQEYLRIYKSRQIEKIESHEESKEEVKIDPVENQIREGSFGEVPVDLAKDEDDLPFN